MDKRSINKSISSFQKKYAYSRIILKKRLRRENAAHVQSAYIHADTITRYRPIYQIRL